MKNQFKLKRISDGKEFELGEVSLLVGRSDSCDIKIVEGHPSREHARVAERDGGVLVQDLHSTNGTFVNGKRIDEPGKLGPGDVVKFGDEAFSIQSTQAPEATVMMKSLGLDAAQSATLIDDDEDEDEDEDSTGMLEVYALPPGWNEGTGFNQQVGKLDDKKRSAIDRYVDKFRQTLKGQTGVFFIFFSDGNPPVFKSVIVKDGKQKWSFGRSKSCDISFENPCISKHHADIIYSDEGWTLEDKGSTNGVSLKGRREQSIKLEDNMDLEISTVDVLIRFLG